MNSPRLIVLFLLLFNACSTESRPGDYVDENKPASSKQEHLVAGHRLIELENLPMAKEISGIVISRGVNRPAFTEEQFPFVFQKASVVSPKDPILKEWNYSPLCKVDFIAGRGRYHLELFLGGLGFLTLPNAETGALMFSEEALRPTNR